MTTRKLTVLFVDDEARVLEGMRRALHRSRERWAMSFIEGGAAALRSMAEGAAVQREYDVVITDMRMPTMDGAALLAEVARLYPRAVRVVLSGQTHAAAAHRAANVAHRFLAKPIEASEVIALLAQIETVRTLMTDPEIARVIGSTNLIASARDAEMSALCANPGASAAEGAQLIRRSPVLVAKALQLAGSAFFAQPYHGTSIDDVVQHVGLQAVVGVVCGDMPCPCVGHGSDAGEAWSERMRAVAARAVEQVPAGVHAADAFVAALLHDIGRTFVNEGADADLRASVSAYLLGLWGLPDAIVAAVRWQNDPARAGSHRALAGVVETVKRWAGEGTSSKTGLA